MGVTDIFVHDRELQTTERVSIASDETEGNKGCGEAVLSPNGRYVAFSSEATNLVDGDSNGRWDVFVHDRELQTTERVSVTSDGTQEDRDSWTPALSADGRFVAFASQGNLVDDDTDGKWDIFVRDRELQTTERVSVTNDQTAASGDSFDPGISEFGRYVAFESAASNLVDSDTNNKTDIFVYDREKKTTERVSVPNK